jgi:hypothetical protein
LNVIWPLRGEMFCDGPVTPVDVAGCPLRDGDRAADPGHKSNTLVGLHKVSIVWAAVFGVHFLAHLLEMLDSMRSDRRVAGAAVRLVLVAGSVIVGVGLAVSLLHPITGRHA